MWRCEGVCLWHISNYREAEPLIRMYIINKWEKSENAQSGTIKLLGCFFVAAKYLEIKESFKTLYIIFSYKITFDGSGAHPGICCF